MVQNIMSIDFLVTLGLDVYRNLIKRLIFDDSNQTEIRSFSTFSILEYIWLPLHSNFFHGEEFN